jgi:alditol oxidase
MNAFAVARTNWAGNVTFSAREFHRPDSVDELRQLVTGSSNLRILGTGHSFSRVADTTGDLVSLAGLPSTIDIDSAGSSVRVSGAVRFGELGRALHPAGFALVNTASLPHISVAGAVSTGTHGSGMGIGNLSTTVSAIELLTGDGEVVSLSRETDGDTFNGMVLALGALGVIISLTLDIVPTFHVRQDVYDDLSDEDLLINFDQVMGSGYSVSAFSTWRRPRTHHIWQKRVTEAGDTTLADPALLSAALATAPRHPLEGMPVENVTEQLGQPGPWNERLPHFRLDFVPSSGEELQTEYFVPFAQAADALRALDDIHDEIAQALQVSELRTIAGDDLWLSPSYHRDSVALHFTWVPNEAAVVPVVTAMEQRLTPFGVRPHWGKVFTVPAADIDGQYERLPDFRALARQYDPAGKFRNQMVQDVLSLR